MLDNFRNTHDLHIGIEEINAPKALKGLEGDWTVAKILNEDKGSTMTFKMNKHDQPKKSSNKDQQTLKAKSAIEESVEHLVAADSGESTPMATSSLP